MKIGFSSLVCPTWSLETIVANAAKFGFSGVELRGLCGELQLPLVPALARDPESVRRLFADHKIDLVCLGASATLSSKSPREVAKQKGVLTEFMELAARLGCPNVRIFAGETDRLDNQRAALARVAEALSSMAPIAGRMGVTLLVENGGDFPGSTDLWFLIDAVGHPAVACCWNQCHAMTLGERATNSIPRLGNKIGMVHIGDGKFDAGGALLSYTALGEGDIGIQRQIEILKGLLYDRYLIFEWPKLWVDSLPQPESVLPGTAKFLREAIGAKQPILSAYKGDKNAPKLASRAPQPKLHEEFTPGRGRGSRQVIVLADAQGWAAGGSDPLVLVLLVCALASAALRRRLPHGTAWVGFVFFLSAAGAVASDRFRFFTATPTQHVAWFCAFLCLFWSLVTALVTPSRRHEGHATDVPRISFVFLGRLAAMLFGVITAIIQSIVLVMRMIYVGVDIVHGYPWEGVRDYGFGPLGLWSFTLLFVSCGIGLLSTGARRLITVQLWMAILFTLWACLLYPQFRMNVSGGFERTGGTLLLLTALSTVLTVGIVAEGWLARRYRRRGVRTDSTDLPAQAYGTPGFVASCGVLAIVIIILACYHLLVPVRTIWGAFHGTTLLVSVSTAVAAVGCFLLWNRSSSDNVGDAAMGLASLSLCGLTMLTVPGPPITLSERYPMMFNAMIVGLTLAMGLWTWFSCVWGLPLDDAGTMTTTARLVPHAKRFAFLSAALALVAGALMTYWPRLPTIASMDHSLGRITAGLAAHLFLLLVMLWCSRQLRRLTFNLLTVMAVVSTAGFIIIRMVPFASRLG